MKKLRGRGDGDDLAGRGPIPRPVRPANDHQVEDVGRVGQLAEGERGPAPLQDQLLDSFVADEGLM